MIWRSAEGDAVFRAVQERRDMDLGLDSPDLPRTGFLVQDGRYTIRAGASALSEDSISDWVHKSAYPDIETGLLRDGAISVRIGVGGTVTLAVSDYFRTLPEAVRAARARNESTFLDLSCSVIRGTWATHMTTPWKRP